MAEVVTMGATAAERAIASTEARGTASILDGRLSKRAAHQERHLGVKQLGWGRAEDGIGK